MYKRITYTEMQMLIMLYWTFLCRFCNIVLKLMLKCAVNVCMFQLSVCKVLTGLNL